jgi:hypothetical protein
VGGNGEADANGWARCRWVYRSSRKEKEEKLARATEEVTSTIEQ